MFWEVVVCFQKNGSVKLQIQSNWFFYYKLTLNDLIVNMEYTFQQNPLIQKTCVGSKMVELKWACVAEWMDYGVEW